MTTRTHNRVAVHTRTLADVNDEGQAYQVIRDDAEALIEALGEHVNEEDWFYRVRDLDTATLDPVRRVARLIYLNRTCFNKTMIPGRPARERLLLPGELLEPGIQRR